MVADKETSTLELGWPVDIPFVLVNQCIYLPIKDSIDVLGIKKHVEARGWKKIENFLTQQGINDGFVMDGIKKTLIIYAAFVAILFGYAVQKDGEHDEAKQHLRTFLLDKLHQAELQQKCKTPSPKRKNTQPETPSFEDDASSVHCPAPNPGSTRLSAKENLSPLKHLVNSPLKTGKGTNELIERERASNSDHKHGRRLGSRPLMNRVRIQENTLSVLARRVHRGSKEDFMSALSCSVVADGDKTVNPETDRWNGKFSVQDIVKLTKMIHVNKSDQSLYESLTGQYAAEEHHIPAHDILHVQDNCSASDTVDYVRKRFPGLICSSYAVGTLKNKMKVECDAVLQPKRCATGWRIELSRLHSCLQFVYPWLQHIKSEWWKLYGDARTYGKQKSVAFAIGNVNNEQSLNGCSYQSPKEMWPVCLFYGGDSRLNLELNLEEGTQWLSNWVTDMEMEGHSVYIIGDSMFLDAMADTNLDPTSRVNISIYNYETVDTKGMVDSTTGVRSGLGRKIEREIPNAILKGLPTDRYVLCVNHMMTRITEALLTQKVKSLYNMEAKSLITKRERDSLVQRLEANINARGVRGGNFKFLFEAGKNKLLQVSLNKTCAQLISAPPSFFKDATYPHIMDGVSKNVFLPKELPPALKDALEWPTSKITEYDCETLLWKHHFNMHEINRMEPTPVLISDENKGSTDACHYVFGVSDAKVESYVKSADIFHGLVCFLYGSDALAPYMMKCIDIVPILLKPLSFKCMMRMSTEGGERMHYLHQQRFFQYSSRGGGWEYQDPLLHVFYHVYREVRDRVRHTEKKNQEKFEAFVGKCLTESKEAEASSLPDCHGESDPDLPLSGQRFGLVGSFASIKMNQDKLKEVISAKGGQVLNIASVPETLPVDVVVISTQKECDKGSTSPGITTAFQRNWKIVSPQYVLAKQEGTHSLSIEDYLLCLDKIHAAPGTSAVHTKVSTVADTAFKRCGAFRDLKLTLHNRVEGTERLPKSLESTPKRSHHKKRIEPLKQPPTAFGMFLKEKFPVMSAAHGQQDLGFKEALSILAVQYNGLPLEVKEEYQHKAWKHFEEVNQTFSQ